MGLVASTQQLLANNIERLDDETLFSCQATLAQTYTFQARARDEAGNTGLWTETGVVEISPVTNRGFTGRAGQSG